MNDEVRSGTFSVGNLPTATDEGSAGHGDDMQLRGDLGCLQAGYAARSTGKCRDVEKAVHCTLRLRGPFDFSLFTRSRISLKSGSIVDWYNYSAGDVGNQIGTNSTEAGSIELYSGVTIRGDVVTGPGEDPDVVIKDNGATITGGTYAQLEENVLLPVTVPAFIQTLPSSGILDKRRGDQHVQKVHGHQSEE